ncbi:Glycoprotein hormone alpha-2 [Channa argus]|uniref:Glycoprotein hormone alpha-2 n=1 Tax=Channa argus TaxID=215402 RepID=A0A6G1Q5G6_CHAAH|nr:Glycoprotein hormone alpha-2 [Channa argus]
MMLAGKQAEEKLSPEDEISHNHCCVSEPQSKRFRRDLPLEDDTLKDLTEDAESTVSAVGRLHMDSPPAETGAKKDPGHADKKETMEFHELKSGDSAVTGSESSGKVQSGTIQDQEVEQEEDEEEENPDSVPGAPVRSGILTRLARPACCPPDVTVFDPILPAGPTSDVPPDILLSYWLEPRWPRPRLSPVPLVFSWCNRNPHTPSHRPLHPPLAFNVTIRSDRRGTCKGTHLVNACVGYCESSAFPSRYSVLVASNFTHNITSASQCCTISKDAKVKVRLDCPLGRHHDEIEILTAKACRCDMCRKSRY